jgi:sterol desaturase/sphingolipid hydroxylase (fatty acid hydroxylase superfamily)
MSIKERLYRFRSFWFFPLLGIGLLYLTFRDEPRNLLHLFWLFPLGVLAWTLIEYGLHRFAFHVHVTNPKLRELINGSHMNHHRAPRDKDRLFVHVNYGLLISALIFGGLYAIFGRSDWVIGMICGIWAGFLYYESVHYRSHVTAATRGLIGRQRRAHFYHHFTDNTRCFGVTSPLWDYVFRTQLPQPRR